MRLRHKIILFIICVAASFGGCNSCCVSEGSGCDLSGTVALRYYAITSDSANVLYSAGASLHSDLNEPDDLYVTNIISKDVGLLTEDFPSTSRGTFVDFQISPNNDRVVLNNTDPLTTSSNGYVLYSVSLDGGDVTMLAGSINRSKYAISNNSETVVFISSREVTHVDRLYSVPIGGGDITRLSSADSADTDNDVSSFEISYDDSLVVFAGDLETDEKYELYSVAIGGGDETKISKTGETTYDLEDFIDITQSDLAVFYGTADGETTADLYVTPITEANVVNLTPAEYPTTDNYAMNSLSGLVVYESEVDDDNSYLVVVSTDDLTAVELVDDLVPDSCFAFNYDGSFILFHEEDTGLHVISSAGGTPMLLTDDISTDGSCAESQFVMTHDNQYVLYRSGSEAVGYVLNRVSVTTGEILVLADHDDLGIIDSFKVSDDSSYVVVEGAESEDSAVNELYSISIDGGELVKISE